MVLGGLLLQDVGTSWFLRFQALPSALPILEKGLPMRARRRKHPVTRGFGLRFQSGFAFQPTLHRSLFAHFKTSYVRASPGRSYSRHYRSQAWNRQLSRAWLGLITSMRGATLLPLFHNEMISVTPMPELPRGLIF